MSKIKIKKISLIFGILFILLVCFILGFVLGDYFRDVFGLETGHIARIQGVR